MMRTDARWLRWHAVAALAADAREAVDWISSNSMRRPVGWRGSDDGCEGGGILDIVDRLRKRDTVGLLSVGLLAEHIT